MWKIAVGFVVFAALALFVLSRSGGNMELGGEKHGVDSGPTPVPAASAPADAASASK